MNAFHCVALRPKVRPVGQRLIGARESALQHEFAHRAMRNSSCGLQCTLGVARQPKIEFFSLSF
jgi:hypothetical protein